jgi:VWFA-related protein
VAALEDAMKATVSIVAGLCVLGLAAVTEAQRLTEEIRVTMVEVPVRVTDRSGAPIRGLTAANFEILDDGERKAIESFEVIEMGEVSSVPLDQPVHPAAHRNFLFLFDLSNSSPGTIGRAREATRLFIETGLGPRDLAAVATFSVEHGVRLLTSFTRDRELVAAAVETLGHPKYFRAADPLFISADVSQGGGTGGREEISDAIGEAINELVEQSNRLAQQGDDSYQRSRLRIQFQQFENVARVLDRLRGQKQIILLSEGFDARLVHGREEIGGVAGRAEMDAAMSGEVWKIQTDQTYGSSTSSSEIRKMGEIFRRSDVVLHSIDIKGLRTDVDAREGARRSSNEALFLLSEPTGGQVFKNANDLSTSFARMLDQQDVIYVLGFRATQGDEPGKFRSLRVRAVDVRGARLQHRAGYYEPSGQVSPLERALSAAEILFHEIPVDQVAVEIQAFSFPTATGAQVPVVLEIDGVKLLEAIDGDLATGDIYIYAFTRKGEVAGYLHQELSLDLTKASDILRKAGIRYYGTLLLEEGDYLVKTLVRINENNRAGYRSVPLHVPRFDQPAVLQPLLFAEQGDWIMMRGDARPGIEYPFVVGSRSFIPEVSPKLDSDGNYHLALFTYHVPAEQLGLTASVTSVERPTEPAAISLVGRTPVEDDGAVKYLFQFSPEDLPPGEYALEMKVTPEGQLERVVSMPFVVH